MKQSPLQVSDHFSSRVIHQARAVVEAWSRYETSENPPSDLWRLFSEDLEKLDRLAERFELRPHADLARALLEITRNAADTPLAVRSGEVNTLLGELLALSRRRDDQQAPSAPEIHLQRAVYVALQDTAAAERITQQLRLFGFRCQNFEVLTRIEWAARNREPRLLILDTDFGGRRNQGIALAKVIQQSRTPPLPIIFVCAREDDIETRLEACRAGGEAFVCNAGDSDRILDKAEFLTRGQQKDVYRVLVIDDSRAQAAFMENSLRKAGMEVMSITDPLQALEAFQTFRPELIIMDMYMPECNGTELARVLRQDDKFMGIPIIYLSAEDDVNKQLQAMSLGGDDFLVKPINPRHLEATIHNRGRRARALNAMLIRDGLTGLLDHTHIFAKLDDALASGRKEKSPVTIAMIDVDHFKRVNDEWGHAMGDRVLRSLSLFLRQRLRQTDYAGRCGGEEFMIVFSGTTLGEAYALLDELRRRFADLDHGTQPEALRVTFSAGVAEARLEEDARSLGRRADEALYRAKHAGRNRILLHTPALESASR